MWNEIDCVSKYSHLSKLCVRFLVAVLPSVILLSIALSFYLPATVYGNLTLESSEFVSARIDLGADLLVKGDVILIGDSRINFEVSRAVMNVTGTSPYQLTLPLHQQVPNIGNLTMSSNASIHMIGTYDQDDVINIGGCLNASGSLVIDVPDVSGFVSVHTFPVFLSEQ
jgi:hypothetical protein